MKNCLLLKLLMGPHVVFSLITPSDSLLKPQIFLKQFEFANDYERQYVRQISKQALAKKNRIYMLTDGINSSSYGFFVASVNTQVEVSEKSGISQASLSQMESGENKLRKATRVKLASALGIHLDQLK